METLIALEHVKTRLSEMYDGLCGIFHADREAFNLFTHLKLDEISHRNLLQNEIRSFWAGSSIARELALDAGMLDRIKEELEQFMEGLPSATLDEALHGCFHFERSTAELYLRQNFKNPMPQFARLMAILHSGSLEHCEKLRRFAVVRGMDGRLSSEAVDAQA